MSLVARKFKISYAAFFSIFAIFGTSMTVVGATLPRILGDFGWSYGQAGIVIAGGAIAYFLSTYAAGRIVGRIGPKASILFGIAACAVALALFASSPSLAMNLLLYALVGAGQGFLEVSINWCVLRMGEPADAKAPRESAENVEGRALSLIHGAFAIGAVVGPFAVGSIMSVGLSWSLVYRVIAGVFGLSFLFVLPLDLHALGREKPKQGGSSRGGFRRSPAYWLGFATLFLYVGAELGISNWAGEYFVRIFGTSDATGSFMVSLFWAGLMAGRLGIPALLKRVRQDRLLFSLSVLLSVATGLLAASGVAGHSGFGMAALAITVAGLGASCVYPAAVSLVGAAFPENQGEAIGFASTGGGVGAFVFPFLMSRIASGYGVLSGFAFYAAITVLSAATAATLGHAVRARRAAFKA